MGKRGPRPKPAGVLKLRGTYREDRHGGRIEPPAGELVMPDWLDERGRQEWACTMPQLAAGKIATPWDANILGMHCQSVADYRYCRQRIAKEGWIVGGRLNPLIRLMRDSWDRALKSAKELGLTPAARASLKMPATEEKNDTDGFFHIA